MKYKKIAFLGMMGSGKTSAANAFSKLSKIELFDLDDIFVNKYSIEIKDYFAKYGEDDFRKKETELLENISKKDSFILSTGGGIILSNKNRNILFKKDIYTIYLKTSIDTIYERLKDDRSRPLLLVKDPKEEIKKILSTREKYYSMANLVINTDNKTIDEISEELYNKLS